ncbi:autophagy protein atg9 [Gryganskiella cystojenkinii]|nr:autophagy protein atg9 [Gryganskiella cystojenkinii]
MHRQHSYQSPKGSQDESTFLNDATDSHAHSLQTATTSTSTPTNAEPGTPTSNFRHLGSSALGLSQPPPPPQMPATLAHDPPLMPLFTPVLQDFQNRYGSSILQQYPEGDHHSHNHQLDHEDDLTDSDDARAPPDFLEQERPDYEDDEEEEEDDRDADASSRRNLLFSSVGLSNSNNNSNNTNNSSGRLLFSSPRHATSNPFALNSFGSEGPNNARNNDGAGGPSRMRPTNNLDIGTDHEAPASLMIEMNHQEQDEDESTGYWNFGDRARQRFQYKRPGMNAAELAMWKWVNVENLDNFLAKVYDYYIGKGMYTILLERCLNLFTFAFVIGFSTFLIGCVDYPRLRHSRHLEEVLVPQCFHQLSTGTFIVLLLFAAFWVGQLTRLIYEIPEMSDMCSFYTHLLQIPDEDIQTVSWSEVVARIIKIRDNNPNTTTTAAIQTTDTQRLNAHDIANRIMRKENFMIAMFNKELLDLTIPLPMVRNRTILTRILEWSLGFCILGYVFDERGQVRKRFLKDTRRAELVDGLRRRFQFMGLATLLFSPFISIYLVLYFFFRYFEEYHKNPSSIGTRQYTPVAKWKFKEFNELPHLFDTRINGSYPLAMKYINLFPKEKTILICRFVAFISGSFAAVLALMTLFDQELLLGLEITSEKTVFFYLGLFGTIMAVSRGMIPDQTESFDPELLLRGVVEYTHYMPNEWREKLHTDEVRKQFALLFEYNVVLFLLEFMSLVLTPLVLCISLASCSEKIIDFFREFTVHVDGVGYVCSFAVFDFKRHGNVKYGAPAATTDERFVSNEGKMEKSFLNFKQNNPDWEPNDPAGSMYLSKLLEVDKSNAHGRHHLHHHHDQPPLSWGQSSAYMRPRGGVTGTASQYLNYQDRSLYHGKSKLGRQYQQESEGDDEDDNNQFRNRIRGSPGVKFQQTTVHTAKQRKSATTAAGATRDQWRPHHDPTESESSEYGHDHDADQHPKVPFKSNLGDSFVSEIGQSSTHRASGAGGKRGRDNRSKSGTSHDLADSIEDERDSQKKGVFGLLNQIYEMNNVTM